MHPIRNRIFLLGLALFFAETARSATYTTIYDIHPAGHTSSVGQAMNESGMIVGNVDFQPMKWTLADGWTPIPGTSPSGEALSVNESGEIVGYSYTLSQPFQAFFWSPASGFNLIGPMPGDLRSEARGVNDAGQVVGTSYELTSNPSNSTAFRWTLSGGFAALGNLGAPRSFGRGINNSGDTAGSSLSTSDNSSERAFIKREGENIQSIGTPNPNDYLSTAAHIDDNGLVVGYYNNSLSHNVAYLWADGFGFQSLPPLQNHANSEALASNRDGYIVGYSDNGNGSDRRAVVWLSGIPVDLNIYIPHPNRFGLRLMAATDINERREITGVARTRTGEIHAFLLTPFAPVFSASPAVIPVCDDSGHGNTTLSWYATLKSEIHLDSPTGKLFTRSGPGEWSLPTGDWITHGRILYLQNVSGGSPGTTTDTLTLHTKGCGTLSLDPVVCSGGGRGSTTVHWNSTGARTVEVHVNAPDGPRFAQSGPGNHSQGTGDWVRSVKKFFLQDVSDGRPLTAEYTLATASAETTGCE